MSERSVRSGWRTWNPPDQKGDRQDTQHDPHQRQAPPAKFVFDDPDRRGEAIQSMVSGGCVVSGAHVEKSLLFSYTQIEPYSFVSESVVLPDVRIGQRCRINRAIIDRGIIIEDRD